ncbi:MAG: Gfo/Idh/MocA family oxidoreductase [Victivallales bacterium]|nr:Gfo/Idh/MocA family oxidoreductase [Victivallales bacterium]
MKTYHVGLIGCGFIGKVHAFAHQNIPFFYDQRDFRTKITHICTAHQDTAERACELLGANTATTDFRTITENPDIDIVDIASPNQEHAPAILSAIAHGKHIYCDKPLSQDLPDALRVAAALPSYHAISQMVFHNRFFPSTLRAKQLMEEGRIGDVLEFRARYLHSGSADPNAPLSWKMAAGVVGDLGSHILDLMNHLLGDFTGLSAFTRIAFPERRLKEDPSRIVKVPAEDSMHVTLQLPNGAIGTVTASKITTGAEDELSFEIHGTKGAIALKPMCFDKLWFYDVSAPASPIGGTRGWTIIDCGQRYDKPAGFPPPKAPIGWLRAHTHCLYTFLRSVHENHPYGPSLEQGVKIQKLLEAVRISAANQGQWTNL